MQSKSNNQAICALFPFERLKIMTKLYQIDALLPKCYPETFPDGLEFIIMFGALIEPEKIMISILKDVASRF